MSQSQDREGGAFFANTKKQSQSAPDYRGSLRLSPEVVDNLVQQLSNGVKFPEIELAGWKKTASSGTTYISMNGKKPYVKGESSGQAPRQQQQWPSQQPASQWKAPTGFEDDLF